MMSTNIPEKKSWTERLLFCVVCVPFAAVGAWAIAFEGTSWHPMYALMRMGHWLGL